jgi:hypothetical protein
MKLPTLNYINNRLKQLKSKEIKTEEDIKEMDLLEVNKYNRIKSPSFSSKWSRNN